MSVIELPAVTKRMKLLKGSTLITKKGCVNIEQIPIGCAEVWTGNTWTECQFSKSERVEEIYRVRFNDGTFILCTGEHKFPVYSTATTLTQKHPQNLSAGSRVYTFHYDLVQDRISTDTLPYRAGVDMSATVQPSEELPIRDVITKYNMRELIEFITGWAQIFGGLIIGHETTLREMQLCLHCHMVTVTHLDIQLGGSILYLSSEYKKIFGSAGTQCLFYKELKNGSKRVLGIDKIAEKKKSYQIETMNDSTIIVNSTVLNF